MKLVVDTNVLVSGVLWQGLPQRLIKALEDGRAKLILSTDMMSEFYEVIRRPKFARRLAQLQIHPKKLVTRLARKSTLISAPSITPPTRLRDPNDVIVLAAALCSRADVIVSGDIHLLELKSFEGIWILNVQQVLERMGVPNVS